MSRPAPWTILTLLSLLLPTAAAADEVKRVAVLPVEAVNLKPAHRTGLAKLFVQRLRRLSTLEIAGKTPVEVPESCTEQPTCLARIARRHGADLLVGLRAGGLGGTFVLRLAVFDGRSGTRVGSWQEVLHSLDREALVAALDRMTAGFAPRPDPAPPWYARWWVWTAAGVVIAGTVTAVLLTTRDSDERPPVVITSP